TFIASPYTTAGDGVANEGVIEQTGSGGNLIIDPNTFTNSGTIDAEAAGGYLAIEPRRTFTNSGTIDAANGERVRLKPNGTGKGTDTISSEATLEFGAGVSTATTLGDQDITFTGAGTLHLLKPADFYGEISGFEADDRIKLLGSWAFHSISEAGDVTTLTLA